MSPRASEEDIALVAKNEDQIRADVSIYSFDIAAMKKRVPGEDPTTAFVQAHLHLGHVITCLLSENIPNPRHLQLDRIGFSQKLQLVAALGLLAPFQLAPIKVVNAIRNKVAHKLEYLVTPEDEAKLRSSMGKHLTHDEDGTDSSLQMVLMMLAVMIDLHRQEHAFRRIMGRRAMVNARVVLDRADPQ